MKYEDVKSFIKDGDILTFAGNWLMSRAIRWWTGQPVSHVGIVLWLRFGRETEDRLCVLESMEPGGIRVIPLSMAFETSSKIYWHKLDGGKVNPTETIGWAIEQWGGKYANWFQFLSFISPTFRHVRHLFGRPDKIGVGYHCSGLVAEALKFGGFNLPKDSSLVTPGDIWTFDCLDKPVLLEV